MTRRSGIAALALASITVGLLLATGTVAVDTVDENPEKQRGQSAGGTDAQSEYTRLLALARANQKPVSEQQGRIDVSGLPAIGSTDAVLAIVEFSSFQCGYCRRHFAATMPLLRAHYVDTGRLRYFFRDLALQPSQQHAAGAAEAAYCAEEQDRYMAFRDRLFQPATDLAPASLPDHARSVGLDLMPFRTCIESGRHHAKSTIDPVVRRQLQIRGTPTFIIGFLDRRTEKVIALRRISGARPIDLFQQQLAELEPVTLRMSLHEGPINDLKAR